MGKKWHYVLGHVLIRWIFRILFGLRIKGWEKVPKEGPVIIAPNHRSNYDPPLVGAAIPQREVYYFAKKGLFTNKLFSWFLMSFNAFPADTERVDMAAIRKAINILKEGKALMMFPEGTRSKTGEFLPAQPGVGWLALKLKVPIVPVLIWGTHEPMWNHFFKRTPFYIKFADPVYPEGEPSTENGRKLSQYVLDKIKEMVE